MRVCTRRLLWTVCVGVPMFAFVFEPSRDGQAVPPRGGVAGGMGGGGIGSFGGGYVGGYVGTPTSGGPSVCPRSKSGGRTSSPASGGCTGGCGCGSCMGGFGGTGYMGGFGGGFGGGKGGVVGTSYALPNGGFSYVPGPAAGPGARPVTFTPIATTFGPGLGSGTPCPMGDGGMSTTTGPFSGDLSGFGGGAPGPIPSNPLASNYDPHGAAVYAAQNSSSAGPIVQHSNGYSSGYALGGGFSGLPALPGCCSPVGPGLSYPGGPGYSYPVVPGYGGMGDAGNASVGGPSGDSPDSAGQQPGVTGSTSFSINDPAAVLARFDDLNLTIDQVRRLEKMVKSGNKHAAMLLTREQKKTLRELAGIPDKSRAKKRPQSSGD